ncbi:hypothetical protein A2572_03665 [Candidatus Collierbacteria bacterium RIFOXYD1_FULL_40_9]|uniref:Uncharacterized protein n=1 Tax=Candidatus Collierbacteria bacterium RIFOXYD1_FULL_40_9 TaxID=1817731 RepID=A0A1F5FTJ4_9BACT|nr:MAG: hypothetical protein A2572_03665 [Candidatus Collierbacteria bacterium RIFOXYD1_FULL_40_9]
MPKFDTSSVMKLCPGLTVEDLTSLLLSEVPSEAKELRVIIYREVGKSEAEIKSFKTGRGDLDTEYHYTTDKDLVGSVMVEYVLVEPQSVHLPQSWIISV